MAETPDQSVPPQNAVTPPTVNNADSTAVTSAPTTLPVTPSPTAPVPVAGQDMRTPNPNRGIVSKVFNAIAGPNVDYAQTDRGPVPVKTDYAPGELARKIVASAASLISSGIAGQQAARNRRPLELNPSTTLGAINTENQQAKLKQAQAQWQNQREANEDTLRAAQNVRDQTRLIAEQKRWDIENKLDQQKYDETAEINSDRAWNQFIQHTQDYNKAVNTAGAQFIKGADGQPLNFRTPQDLRDYYLKHPEIAHGTTTGNPSSKFTVAPVINPYTGFSQLVDLPANLHDRGLSLVGVKRDKNNKPITDRNGDYVPDGSVLDPISKKPTYLTEDVSAAQESDIKAKQLTEDKIRAEILNIKDEMAKRDREWNENQELHTAEGLYNAGKINDMTPAQKEILKTGMFQDLKLVTLQDQAARKELDTANAHSNMRNESDEEKAKNSELIDANKHYKEIHENYLFKRGQYDELSGNGPGKQLGNRLLREANGNIDYSKIAAKIEESGLPDPDIEAAKALVWNSMTPSQQDAQKKLTEQIANQKVLPHKKPQAPPAEGQAYIFDPSGNAHSVAADRVDDYLSHPEYAGWSK